MALIGSTASPRRRLAYLGVIALLLAACGAGQGESAPSSGALGSSGSKGEAAVVAGQPYDIPGQLVTGSAINGSPEVGACGLITGEPRSKAFVEMSCTDLYAPYRVVQVAQAPTDCPTDVDRRYFRGFNDGKSFALCLDYNWRDNVCIATGVNDAFSYLCGQRTRVAEGPGYRLRVIHADETSKNVCGQGPNIVHEKRKYVVCLERE